MRKLRIFSTVMLIFLVNFALAQGAEISLWQSHGKVWVVIGVITIVFIGILLFLVMLERRISNLEKQME